MSAAVLGSGASCMASPPQQTEEPPRAADSGLICLVGAAFFERWSSDLILFTSRASLVGCLAKFDVTWFIPAVVKYRRLLLKVLFVSFVLLLFALVTPLF